MRSRHEMNEENVYHPEEVYNLILEVLFDIRELLDIGHGLVEVAEEDEDVKRIRLEMEKENSIRSNK